MTMETKRIRNMVATVAELARLLPEDSQTRLAVSDGQHYWEQILEIVEAELDREESWSGGESLLWDRLSDLRGQLLGLIQAWNNITHPVTSIVPLENQCSLTFMYNLRRRRRFETA
jgi:hypothetical protein